MSRNPTRRNPRAVYTAVLTAVDDYGERKVPGQCALATDLKNRYPEIDRPHVNTEVISFTDTITGERLTWPTPESASYWIWQWDQGETPDDHPVRLERKYADVKTKRQRKAKIDREKERYRNNKAAGTLPVKGQFSRRTRDSNAYIDKITSS